MACGELAGDGNDGDRVAVGDEGCGPFEHQHEGWRKRVFLAVRTDQREAAAMVRFGLKGLDECLREHEVGLQRRSRRGRFIRRLRASIGTRYTGLHGRHLQA
jgi:hypothetical protein